MSSSNSPLRTPPRKVLHSAGVNRSMLPCGSLLSRTPTYPPLKRAASTQLPLAKLNELLIHAGLWSLPFASVTSFTLLPPVIVSAGAAASLLSCNTAHLKLRCLLAPLNSPQSAQEADY